MLDEDLFQHPVCSKSLDVVVDRVQQAVIRLSDGETDLAWLRAYRHTRIAP